MRNVWVWFVIGIVLDQLYYYLVTPHLAHQLSSISSYWHASLYAVPAAVGLALAGRLASAQAAGFAVLVACAHALAVWVAMMPFGDNLHLPDYVVNGFMGGLLGAALSLFGLALIAGARTAAPFRTAALFTAVLALMGACLLPVMLNDSVHNSIGDAQVLALYVPWQAVFSWAIVLVLGRKSAPA